jgi:hypothetical protein
MAGIIRFGRMFLVCGYVTAGCIEIINRFNLLMVFLCLDLIVNMMNLWRSCWSLL